MPVSFRFCAPPSPADAPSVRAPARPGTRERRPLRCRAAVGVATVLLLAGCQTYTDQTAQRDAALREGSLQAAAAMATQDAERHKNDKDAVLFRLEQGAILRQAALARVPAPGTSAATEPRAATTMGGRDASRPDAVSPAVPAAPETVYLQGSLTAFDQAEARMQAFEEQARIRLGASSAALLTNQATLPYRGRAYDKIMMNAYKALNHLQLGNRDAARVELNRALQRQREAVTENARQLEEAQQTAREARAGRVRDDSGRPADYDIDQAIKDPSSGVALAAIETELDARIRPYGDYVNPFVVFLDGLFFLTQAEDLADLERARVSLRRVASLAPENPYAKADAAMAEAAAIGQPPSGLTYVIFETGSAPYRVESRIDIPLLGATRKISYVGASFPRLRFTNDYVPVLTVTSGTTSFTSSLLSSMDSVVARDLKNEWPSIVTKTLLSTVAKAAADMALQKQATDKWGEGGQLLARLAGAALQFKTNIADTRTWRSLPKEFHTVRLPTPENRRLTLSAGAKSASVDLLPGSIQVVYVKSTAANAPLVVSQFVLKPAS